MNLEDYNHRDSIGHEKNGECIYLTRIASYWYNFDKNICTKHGDIPT